jgi:hypothetical protein
MNFIKKAFNTEVEPEKVNNFPPCCPFMYMSLSECGDKKFLVIMGGIEYIVFCLIAIANFVCAIISLTAGGYNSSYLGMTVMASCYMVFIPFVAFFVQFYPVYGACKGNNSIRYYIFFIAYALCVLFSVLMAIGVPNVGGCGLIAALGEIRTKRYTPAVFQFIMMGIWISNAFYAVIIIALMYKYFYDDGGGNLSNIRSSVTGMFARQAIRSQIGV